MGAIFGCDISKRWIDVCTFQEAHERCARIANERVAIRSWARALPAGALIGMEATGRMHELLADTVHEMGHRAVVVNARWIHNYRAGRGVRGKTDKTDAALIARYVGAHRDELHLYVPPSEAQRELRRLLLQRHEAVKLKTAAAQSLGLQANAVIIAFKSLLARIDLRIRNIIRADPVLVDLASRLQTEPGVGPLVAAHLAEVLGRFQFKSSDALVAHTGLDPRPNQSGQKIGRRRLSHHGDAVLRCMLYLAAMTACRQPLWRARFDAYRARGLPSTAAYVAVARRLTRIAFTIFKQGTTYDPSRLMPT
jgi:transposase